MLSQLKELQFIVPKTGIIGKYKVLRTMGTGSFGCVLAAEHLDVCFAIKVIHKSPQFYELGLSEIELIQQLNHPNIVRYYRHFVHKEHLCIVFELLGKNLYEVMKLRQFKPFSSTVVATIGLQLVSALNYLKSLHIMHCDLKPENICFLEEYTTNIKIIDFGSSSIEPQYYYIQSRYYRAPEVILRTDLQGPEMDMFSFGAILAEMHIGRPIAAGKNEKDQFNQWIYLLGPPPDHLLKFTTDLVLLTLGYGSLC